MRELELRLALVCFGGASLAVYMNGVSHEILKLVRASKVYHDLPRADKADAKISYEAACPDRPYGTDTEPHYFELLRALGSDIEIRVVVDVISGASAGGINGIFLARALAYDLDFGPLRDMWMRLGDIEELMEPETLAQRWSKIYMYPLMGLFRKKLWGDAVPHPEAERKLLRFVRSRWFEPPFSGRRMLDWMVNANRNMGQVDAGHSLMPPGHQLDLFVSLTNFYGQPQSIEMHDPATIEEQKHGISLHFSHAQGAGQARRSDFGDNNIPGLGFAARATSSFPGAFPPVRLADLQQYLTEEGLDWPHEDNFMARNFPSGDSRAGDVSGMAFIDGGVTNNKPFANAVSAVGDRPAHREVDRRIVFIDPRPEEPGSIASQKDRPLPGFFRTIVSALAEIPRDQPILGDLEEIEAHNREARRFEVVLDRIDHDVAMLVDRIIVLEPGQKVSTAMLASWRERAHELAHAEAGFGYGSYAETKAVAVLERLGDLIDLLRDRAGYTEPAGAPQAQLRAWARERDFLGAEDPACRSAIPFFREYDVDFRIRRLRFVVKRLNQHIERNSVIAASGPVKALKTHIYDSIARYRRRWQPDFYGELDMTADPSVLMPQMARLMALEDLDFEEDTLLSRAIDSVQDETVRRTLFRAYVGFPFYDILVLPMTAHGDLLEFDEIRVDRISPLDCKHLADEAGTQLMGAQLFNFGAFFSRHARENDYVSGRMHAANRLVDFLIDAAGAEAAERLGDLQQLRRNLALAILDTEQPKAKSAAADFARLRQALEASGPSE